MSQNRPKKKRSSSAGSLLGSLRRRWQLWAGLGIGAVIVVAVVAALQQGGTEMGRAADEGMGFRMVAYQGEDVLGGKEINFSQVLGQGKPVVLNFWAGLCPPCRAEMPDFQRVYNDYKGKVILVGVDIGPFIGLGSNDDARRLLKELNITYPTARAVNASIVRQYNILSMPTTIFFTADGKAFNRHTGILTGGQMRKLFADAIAAASPASTTDRGS